VTVTHNTSLASLVVNKRKLPQILRNDVPPLLVAGTAVVPLLPTPSRLWGVLHSDIGKKIKHKDQGATVVNVHTDIRQLEIDGRRFWVPRRVANRKEMRRERIKRQYTSGLRVAFSGLHYTGQARPVANTVPVECLYREIPPDTIAFLRSLRRPESRLTVTSSTMTRMMSVFIRAANLKLWLHQMLNKKSKQLMENLVVEHLRKSQMSDQRVSAVYDVLVGGVALAVAAKQRGLDESHLRQVVNRVARKVRPVCEARVVAWAGGDEIQKAADELANLETQKARMLNLTPEEVRAGVVAEIANQR
jgi:hypothetical protein